MRALPSEFAEYRWAPSTSEIAAEVGLDPVEIVRFDGNVPAAPSPTARPGAIAAALAGTNEYAHGGFPELVDGIARYAGVEPENVVLGAGADDLILLCARAFAGPGDTVAIAEAPTYPLFGIAAQLTGADDRWRFAGGDVLLPAEQPDRRSRPAACRATARRRRGVLRVRGRDGRRPHSKTASSSCARSRRRSASRARGSATRSPMRRRLRS